MKKPDKDKKRSSRHAVRGGTTRLTGPLKLPKEAHPGDSQPGHESGNGASDGAGRAGELGTLRPNTGKLNIPAALVEASGTRPHKRLLPGSFMLTVIILALIFIGIVALLVSQMPDK